MNDCKYAHGMRKRNPGGQHAQALRITCACTAHTFDSKQSTPLVVMRMLIMRTRCVCNAHAQRILLTSDLHRTVSICNARSLGWGQGTPPANRPGWCLSQGAGAKRLGDAACGVGREDARKSVGNCIAYSWKVLDDCRPIHRIADVQGDLTGNDARVGGWAVHF